VERALNAGRGLLATLALATAAMAAAAGAPGAPASRVYRIGVLNEAWAANHPTVEGLKTGLRHLGLVEGRDVTFDIRFTEGKPGATPVAARALLGAGVVVFTLVGDPVAAGIVARLAQPGGNLTGISNLTAVLTPKRLEVLKTLVPGIRRVWFIYYGGDLTDSAALVSALAAAQQLHLDLIPRTATDPEQLTRILQEVRPGDALLAPSIDTLDIPAAILETSLVARVPAIFPAALWVAHGGLVSYGPDHHAQGVQAARLVAKILRGTAPRELPVEGADKIDLAINLKTAAALDATVPRKLLIRADLLRR
jgi:putative ABC transport system substrate-binding protein